jgi:energy-converting hydrogenase Eha subunit E
MVGLGYDRAMSVKKFLLLPLLIAAVGVIYYWLSYEWIGTVLLVVFAAAMAVMGWILIPTLNDAGPTAPIDPDFEYPGR